MLFFQQGGDSWSKTSSLQKSIESGKLIFQSKIIVINNNYIFVMTRVNYLYTSNQQKRWKLWFLIHVDSIRACSKPLIIKQLCSHIYRKHISQVKDTCSHRFLLHPHISLTLHFLSLPLPNHKDSWEMHFSNYSLLVVLLKTSASRANKWKQKYILPQCVLPWG